MMSWPSQVWHVSTKDVRAQRSLLLIYVIATAFVLWGRMQLPGLSDSLATEQALVVADERAEREALVIETGSGSAVSVSVGTTLSRGPSDFYANVFAWSIGALFLGLAALADSPYGRGSGIASLPLRRSAVLAAKALLATLVLFIASVAHAVPILALDVPWRDTIALTGSELQSMIVWYISAILMGLVARDIRDYVLGLMLLFGAVFAAGFAAFLAFWAIDAFPPIVTRVIVAALLLLGAAATGSLPASPRRAWATRLSLASALLIFELRGHWDTMERPEWADSMSEIFPTASVASTLQLSVPDSAELMEVRWRASIDGLPRSVRALAFVPFSPAHRSTRCQLNWALAGSGFELQHPELPLERSFRWRGTAPDTYRVTPIDTSVVRLVSAERPTGVSGHRVLRHDSGCRYTMHVTAELLETVLVARLPFSVGAITTENGQRTRVVARSPSAGERLAFVTYESARYTNMFADDSHLTAVLVHRERGEALRLHLRSSAEVFAGRISSLTLTLALPAPEGRQPAPSDFGFDSAESLQHWINESELLLLHAAPRGVIAMSPPPVSEAR